MPKFIADLHIHSKYSRATSKLLTPEHLEYWAKIKGIQVVGTGDCIHPGWLKELEEKLEMTENGLYRLKAQYQLPETEQLSNILKEKPVYFMPTTEISNIYKKNDKTRKVHNVCILPNLESVKVFQEKINKIGNIHSDGRPIIGLDSKILLEMLLESAPYTYLIPAHIWTPWFSVLGSKSGFDTIEECYEDLSPHIFALETGLSSDPPMNRVCSFLDKYRLVSNSDAHSPDKLGREANIFDTDLSYINIYKSLKNDDGFLGTIEFFPEEGKYHNDGHRNCNINWTPLETVNHGGLCPVCGKPVTKGVMYRVAELADRTNIDEANSKQTFQSITPLPGLLAEIHQIRNERSKLITEKFFHMTNNLGSEFDILLNCDLTEIKKTSGELIAEGIRRLRKGLVQANGGYDGEFGKINIFRHEEIKNYRTNSLFSLETTPTVVHKYSSLNFNIQQFKETKKLMPNIEESTIKKKVIWKNAEQSEAIQHKEGPCLVLAGPGAGKTKVLTERISMLISEKTPSEKILAVTFSNKATKEMQERLNKLIGESKTKVTTFHKLGLEILRKELNLNVKEKFFGIINQEEQLLIIKKIFEDDFKNIFKKINSLKQSRITKEQTTDTAVELYNQELKKINAIDLNDLLYMPVKLFINNLEILKKYQQKYKWILVDEFQDINPIQYQLLELLSNKNNLFAIGDPDQSIYGFRGSNPELINAFIKDFPDAKLIKLNRSYRCPNTILQSASMTINKPEFLKSDKDGTMLPFKEFPTDGSEAEWIASEIEFIIGGVSNFSMNSGISDGEQDSNDVSLKDIAILCRTKHLFPSISKALNDHRIPHQIVNTESKLQNEPFKTIVETLKSIYFGFNFNQSKIFKEIESMFENGMHLSQITRILCLENNISSEQQGIIENITKPYKNNYKEFFDEASLRIGNDEYDNLTENVSLMTIHASKGLEFKYVFIPGCENKIIPFQLFNKKSKDEIKEEERILYVGMTRAIKTLYLSFARQRKIQNRTIKSSLSPLIKKISDNLLKKDIIELKSKKPGNQLSLF